MYPGHGPVGLLLASLGLSAADVASTGPDLLGIAALVTAGTGVIGTIGALILRYREHEADRDRLLSLLERLVDKEEGK